MTALESPAGPLHIEVLGAVTIVRFTLSRMLDQDVIEDIGVQMYRIVDDQKRRWVVLDLCSVTRLTSAMVAKIICLHKKLQAAGGRLALCNLSPNVLEFFKMLRLPQVLHIYPTLADAIQSFST